MSSTAYETYHRRYAVLRDLVAELELTRAGELPWNDALAAAYDSPRDLLVALHGLWTRRLEARIDLALELGDELPAVEVAAAWREVAAELPAVRRILDAHADDPELQASRQHEHRLVAVAAGHAGVGDPMAYAAARGERVVRELRATAVPSPLTAGLVDRIAALLRAQAAPARGLARMATR